MFNCSLHIIKINRISNVFKGMYQMPKDSRVIFLSTTQTRTVTCRFIMMLLSWIFCFFLFFQAFPNSVTHIYQNLWGYKKNTWCHFSYYKHVELIQNFIHEQFIIQYAKSKNKPAALHRIQTHAHSHSHMFLTSRATAWAQKTCQSCLFFIQIAVGLQAESCFNIGYINTGH